MNQKKIDRLLLHAKIQATAIRAVLDFIDLENNRLSEVDTDKLATIDIARHNSRMKALNDILDVFNMSLGGNNA
jgi:hypothetical protein